MTLKTLSATIAALLFASTLLAQDGEGPPPRAGAQRAQAAPGAGPGGQTARAPTAEEIAHVIAYRRGRSVANGRSRAWFFRELDRSDRP